MFFRFLYIGFFFGLLVCLVTACHPQTSVSSLPVIWDTDIGPDFDDAGALAMLHRLADKGQIHLLATISCNGYANSPQVLHVFNSWYGRPHLPVGRADTAYAPVVPDGCHWTDSVLANAAFRKQQSSADTSQDAIRLYRKLLAAAADHSVVIISTGFFSNLASLLQSPPDQLAPDPGLQLVRRKVKYLVSMAGYFPEGREFNVYNDTRAAAYVADHWPTPIIFSGFEIGDSVFTGLPLLQPHLPESPLRQTFRVGLHCWHEVETGHPSWDETAVLAALDTTHQLFALEPGRIIIHPDGSNAWEHRSDGRQYYLIPKTSRSELAQLINGYLLGK